MQNWYQIIPKSKVLNIYVWIIFCILPFYFTFRSFNLESILFGLLMILLFFISYRLSFVSKNGMTFVFLSFQMIISILMTILLGYVYFSLFLAFFIGNIQNKAPFITLYVVHLVTTIAATTVVVFLQTDLILSQFPFVIVSIIGVILLPFSMYNRMRREMLESKLEDANKRIAELMVAEERQRIARDLHDTLGHKLSLIGLKSDLAGKLLEKNASGAKKEITDIHQTARTALKEVRELVSNMRGVKLKEELIHIQQILDAAKIKLVVKGNLDLENAPLLVENVLSMCLKEAITNVVKHSQATICEVEVAETDAEILVSIKDNGVGISNPLFHGNGLRGIQERLEFVNGELEMDTVNGVKLTIQVPKVVQQGKQEELI